MFTRNVPQNILWYDENGIKHKYFVDIFIPFQNNIYI
jgi:hypothetical protein